MRDTPSTAENIISQEVLTNSVVQVDYIFVNELSELKEV